MLNQFNAQSVLRRRFERSRTPAEQSRNRPLQSRCLVLRPFALKWGTYRDIAIHGLLAAAGPS